MRDGDTVPVGGSRDSEIRSPRTRPDGTPERRHRPTYPSTADAIGAVLDAADDLTTETRGVKELCLSVLRELAAVRGGQIAPASHQIARVVSHALLLAAVGMIWWRVETVADTVPLTREQLRAEISGVVSRMTSDLVETDRRAGEHRGRNAAAIQAIDTRVSALELRVERIAGRIEGMPRPTPAPDPGKISSPTLGPPQEMRRVTDAAR